MAAAAMPRPNGGARSAKSVGASVRLKAAIDAEHSEGFNGVRDCESVCGWHAIKSKYYCLFGSNSDTPAGADSSKRVC